MFEIESLIYFSLSPACPHRCVLLEDSKMKHNLISFQKEILTLRKSPSALITMIQILDKDLLKDMGN